jgi:hypothetical protein
VAFAVIAIGGFVFIVRGEARRLGEEGAADSSEVDSPAATE